MGLDLSSLFNKKTADGGDIYDNIGNKGRYKSRNI